jgi:hypothetical protein
MSDPNGPIDWEDPDNLEEDAGAVCVRCGQHDPDAELSGLCHDCEDEVSRDDSDAMGEEDFDQDEDED